MKVNMELLAQAFGVKLNEEFNLDGIIGKWKICEDGIYRLIKFHSEWHKVKNISFDREVLHG